MTKQSDAWDKRYAERMAKRDAEHVEYLARERVRERIRNRDRELLGLWRDSERCSYCDEVDCKRRICRTIQRFVNVHGFQGSGYYGPLFNMWSIVMYLKCMAGAKNNRTAAEFGKRFPHRKGVRH